MTSQEAEQFVADLKKAATKVRAFTVEMGRAKKALEERLESEVVYQTQRLEGALQAALRAVSRERNE